MKLFGSLIILIVLGCSSATQEVSSPERTIHDEINALIDSCVFSGVVLIQENGSTIYATVKGQSNRELATQLTLNDQFVIGSISKQITAVLVLRAYEKGKIDLQKSIDHYLPQLSEDWRKTVTVHHLLTHTHGILSETEPLEFKPGSQFHYSQLGYHLLAQVLESVEKKSFQELSTSLFRECGLESTFHPDDTRYRRLVKGYETAENGTITLALNSLQNYPAAGSFISNASDLSTWNDLLNSNKLIQKETYSLMEKDYATRIHPIFDSIQYGYGLLFKKGQNTLEIGTFGYASGFVSTSYFYPKTNISLVVLSNYANDPDDFKKIFYVHTELMRIMRELN